MSPDRRRTIPTLDTPHIAVIGAGIGGLSAALRLAYAGLRVSVFEAASGPGGKMRTRASVAGPVDAGPTVLTMKGVFDALFADVGARLEDHVTLTAEPTLARHFWRDGTVLDLMADADASVREVERVFGHTAAREFAAFSKRAQTLFDAFDAPMMQAPAPSQAGLTAKVLRNPSLIPAMAPHQTLAQSLQKSFSEPKLAQLFARYATYVGGLPEEAPAILALIWAAEQRGVWHVTGGMHALARAIAGLAAQEGALFRYECGVTRIETGDKGPIAVHSPQGRVAVDAVLFNGDPRALTEGLLGPAVTQAVPAQATAPRSLSAHVYALAAKMTGPAPLAAHNVFFADDPAREYLPLRKGQDQTDPTLYVCAQDRFGGRTPDGAERFEIIQNAPPLSPDTPPEDPACPADILTRLSAFGLSFDPPPPPETLTSPAGFEALFPASLGSLYGRSPAGMMAAFKRPTARTKLRGLYLVGGGAHPGAGVPMATLSARHAAEAMLSDLALTSPSRLRAMHGGTSTA
ncbi:MAG: 1-hydroxycarotenoid 3,4-desaturase CrtD [Pseudomonadota bacterium]